MNIELGPIGSAIGNVASSVGRAAVGIAESGAGPVSGSMPAFGPVPIIPDIGGKLGGSLGPGVDFIGSALGPVKAPLNEGPAGFLGTENTMTLAKAGVNPSVPVEPVTSDLGGALRPPFIDLVQQPSVFSVIPNEVRNLPTSSTDIAGKIATLRQAQGKLARNDNTGVFYIEQAVAPLVASNIVEFPKPQVENKTSSLVTPAIAPQTEPEEIEEEVVEQVTQPEEGLDSQEIEDAEISRVKIVESVKTSQQRRSEITEAIRKAIELGITVKEALSDKFWKLNSPLVRMGKDWTIDLTAEALNINPAAFSRVEQIEEASIEAVANNIPVEEGESGRQATVGEVIKVTQGEDDKLKPRTPAEIVKKRVAKKRVTVNKTGQRWTVIENRTEAAQENTLKGLSLEEVFQKAA